MNIAKIVLRNVCQVSKGKLSSIILYVKVCGVCLSAEIKGILKEKSCIFGFRTPLKLTKGSKKVEATQMLNLFRVGCIFETQYSIPILVTSDIHTLNISIIHQTGAASEFCEVKSYLLIYVFTSTALFLPTIKS